VSDNDKSSSQASTPVTPGSAANGNNEKVASPREGRRHERSGDSGFHDALVNQDRNQNQENNNFMEDEGEDNERMVPSTPTEGEPDEMKSNENKTLFRVGSQDYDSKDDSEYDSGQACSLGSSPSDTEGVGLSAMMEAGMGDDSSKPDRSRMTLDFKSSLRNRRHLLRSPSSPTFGSLQVHSPQEHCIGMPPCPGSPTASPTWSPPIYAQIRHFAQSPVQQFRHLPIAKNPYMSPYLASDQLLKNLCPVYMVVSHTVVALLFLSTLFTFMLIVSHTVTITIVHTSTDTLLCNVMLHSFGFEWLVY